MQHYFGQIFENEGLGFFSIKSNNGLSIKMEIFNFLNVIREASALLFMAVGNILKLKKLFHVLNILRIVTLLYCFYLHIKSTSFTDTFNKIMFILVVLWQLIK